MKIIFFIITILLTNIIQGITGFAGTILAMPISLHLVGFNTAKPILNAFGILSGFFILHRNIKYVKKYEFIKITTIMITGIAVGLLIKTLFLEKEILLYKVLGILIIFLSLHGIYSHLKKATSEKEITVKNKYSYYFNNILVIIAGIVHGMFVCGGPILIAYLSKKIKNKTQFRATISSVWIVLNTIILADDIKHSLWTPQNFNIFLISTPALFLGLLIGAKLNKKISIRLFMKITYILMLISGISLLIK